MRSKSPKSHKGSRKVSKHHNRSVNRYGRSRGHFRMSGKPSKTPEYIEKARANSLKHQTIIDEASKYIPPQIAHLISEYDGKYVEEKGTLKTPGIVYQVIWRGIVDGNDKRQGVWHAEWIGGQPRFRSATANYVDGKLHSEDDNPALVVEIDDNAYLKSWYRNGVLHRYGKPARVCINCTGGGSTVAYYKEGKLHSYGNREAFSRSNSNGTLVEFVFYKNGKLHKNSNDEPARINYHDNGYRELAWFVNGSKKREGGKPQKECYYPTGEIYAVQRGDVIEIYHKNGKLKKSEITEIYNEYDDFVRSIYYDENGDIKSNTFDYRPNGYGEFICPNDEN